MYPFMYKEQSQASVKKVPLSGAETAGFICKLFSNCSDITPTSSSLSKTGCPQRKESIFCHLPRSPATAPPKTKKINK